MDVDETSSQQDLSRLKFKLLLKHLFKSRVIAIGLIFIFTCLLCALGIEIYLRFFLEDQLRVVPLENSSNFSSSSTTTNTTGVPDNNMRTIRKRYLKNIKKKPSKSVSTSTEDLNITDTNTTDTNITDASVNSSTDTTSRNDPVIILENSDITPVDVSTQTEFLDHTPPPSKLNATEQLVVTVDAETSTQTSTTHEQTIIAQPVQHTPLPSSVVESVPAPVAGIPTLAAFLYYEEGEEADSELEEHSESEPAVRARNVFPGVPVAAPPIPDQAHELELQILQQELAAKNAENAQLKLNRATDQQNFRRDLSISRALITRLQTMYDDNMLVNGQLEQARAVDQQEISRLRRELAAKNEESDQLRQDRETARQENEQLRQDRETAQQEILQLRQTRETIKQNLLQLRQDNIAVFTRLQAEKLQLNRQFRQELTELQQRFVRQEFSLTFLQNLNSTDNLWLISAGLAEPQRQQDLTEHNDEFEQFSNQVTLLDQQEEIQLPQQIHQPPGEDILLDPVTITQPTVLVIEELPPSDLNDMVNFRLPNPRARVNRYYDIIRYAVPFTINQGSLINLENLRLFSTRLIERTCSLHYLPQNIRADLQSFSQNSSRLQLKYFVKFSATWKTACQIIQDGRQIRPTVLQTEYIEISVADIESERTSTANRDTCPFVHDRTSFNSTQEIGTSGKLNLLYKLIVDIYRELYDGLEPPISVLNLNASDESMQRQLDGYIVFYNEMVRDFSQRDHANASIVFKSNAILEWRIGGRGIHDIND